jgi:oxygen-independent coproporphyrinogen III oxidase
MVNIDLGFENLLESLSKKYTKSGPYYTSYPSVGQWSKDCNATDYETALDNLFLNNKDVPLALYLHYPFCPELCSYCCCYVVISKDQERMKSFSKYLLDEVDIFIEYFRKKGITPNIKEIHLGGGSPNVMDKTEFIQLVSKLEELVDISSLDQFALEIDVRSVDREKAIFFHEMGINRISFGVQDFNPEVQKAVNRVQPKELIERLLAPDIRGRFQSVNFDIMWGLPKQTRQSFRKTIQTLKEFSPDRITLLHYGHYPEVYKHQTLINHSDIPSESEKTMMNFEAIKDLEANGYEQIGLDHFAKKGDELVQWKKDKALNRGFIGYPGKTPDLIGMGPSGLSSIGNNFYSQNVYGLQDYFNAIETKTFPILRGYALDPDLVIRREVINKIINYSSLDFEEIEEKFDIDFNNYFESELESLKELIEDGLLELSEKKLKTTPIGKFFVRHICMMFDRFLQVGEAHKPTSKGDNKLAASA